jgi:hypothetical protein
MGKCKDTAAKELKLQEIAERYSQPASTSQHGRVNLHGTVNFWSRFGCKSFVFIAEAAGRLISMHTTSCSSERNWSLWGKVFSSRSTRSSLGKEQGEKMIFIRGNSIAFIAGPSHAVALECINEE